MARPGYKLVKAPGHPLADKRGYVGEHRLVLYSAIGPGRHKCAHCPLVVAWEDGSLHADHKNHVPSDNRRENLQPSCRRCNTKRGRAGARIWERYDRAAFERDGTVIERKRGTTA